MRVLLPSWLLLVVGTLTVSQGTSAVAQQLPTDRTIVDRHLTLAPGDYLHECFNVPATIILMVVASAPEGQADKPAHLEFMEDRQTIRPAVRLFTPLSAETTTSSHLARPGNYCWHVYGADPYGERICSRRHACCVKW